MKTDLPREIIPHLSHRRCDDELLSAANGFGVDWFLIGAEFVRPAQNSRVDVEDVKRVLKDYDHLLRVVISGHEKCAHEL